MPRTATTTTTMRTKAEAPVARPVSKDETVTIRPPKFEQSKITIVGTAPYIMNKFSQKAQNMIIAAQEAGQQGRKGKKRDPKVFEELYQGAFHRSIEGWPGIPASCFRNAMISACRIVGFRMTLAKLSLFVRADGHEEDGTPLVKITKGKPEQRFDYARNATGVVDIRVRPMWRPGWEADVTVRWDSEQFSGSDIANLLSRVGMQVGIGEGRPDSPMSCGMDCGLFDLVR